MRRALWSVSFVGALLCLTAGCVSLEPKPGKLACECAADCPPHWRCGPDRFCYPPDPDAGEATCPISGADSESGQPDTDTDTDSDSDTDTDSDTDADSDTDTDTDTDTDSDTEVVDSGERESDTPPDTDTETDTRTAGEDAGTPADGAGDTASATD